MYRKVQRYTEIYIEIYRNVLLLLVANCLMLLLIDIIFCYCLGSFLNAIAILQLPLSTVPNILTHPRFCPKHCTWLHLLCRCFWPTAKGAYQENKWRARYPRPSLSRSRVLSNWGSKYSDSRRIAKNHCLFLRVPL